MSLKPDIRAATERIREIVNSGGFYWIEGFDTDDVIQIHEERSLKKCAS